jgi:DNA-binding MarR family transcriptional regulator
MKEAEPHPELAPCHCVNIRRVSREVSRFYENLVGQSGLKTTQYALMSLLKLHGPLTMNELSRLSHLERTTLVRKLKPLHREGFTCMCTGGASAANSIQITDKGREILADADPYWRRAQKLLREQFDDSEWEYFRIILQKLNKINNL